MEVSKFLDILKLPLRYMWAIALASGLLLFLPDAFLKRIHVEKLVENFGTHVGVCFIVSVVIVAVHAVLAIWGGAVSIFANRRQLARSLAALASLDSKEKAVLREFFIQGQNTLQLPIDQATVSGLRGKGILVSAGNLGERSLAGWLFPLSISPHIDKYVTLELLEFPSGQPTEDEKRRIVESRPAFLAEIEHHNDVFHTTWRRRLY